METLWGETLSAGVNEPQARRERIVRAHEEVEPTPPGNARAGLG
jgi:hypothetical protein